jgi:hypothetical protein
MWTCFMSRYICTALRHLRFANDAPPRASVAVLYRPYVLSESSSMPSTWQQTALDQARAAASNTNTVLEKIIELDLIHLLKPMM